MPFDPARLSHVEATCLAYLTRSTARAVARQLGRHLSPLGITAEQFSLLIGIATTNDPTIGALARRSGLDRTSVSRAVAAVERAGLIASRGGRGRGGKQVSLTHTGRHTLDAAYQAWAGAVRELE